jgi:hypothetical protein
MPTRKVTAAGIGVAIAIIAVWATKEFAGIHVPPFVAVAAGGLFSTIIAHFVEEHG